MNPLTVETIHWRGCKNTNGRARVHKQNNGESTNIYIYMYICIYEYKKITVWPKQYTKTNTSPSFIWI